MITTLNIEINAPLQKVIDIFTDINSLYKWQEGFQSHERLSGNYLAKGTKSRIIYKNRNNNIELTETILSNDLPNEIFAMYEHKHIVNTTAIKFHKIDENNTRLEYIVEIIKLNGFMIKLMSKLFPNMFKKQTQKWLENFKKMVENY